MFYVLLAQKFSIPDKRNSLVCSVFVPFSKAMDVINAIKYVCFFSSRIFDAIEWRVRRKKTNKGRHDKFFTLDICECKMVKHEANERMSGTHFLLLTHFFFRREKLVCTIVSHFFLVLQSSNRTFSLVYVSLTIADCYLLLFLMDTHRNTNKINEGCEQFGGKKNRPNCFGPTDYGEKNNIKFEVSLFSTNE